MSEPPRLLGGSSEAELRQALAGDRGRLDLRLALARLLLDDGRIGEIAVLLGEEKALGKASGALHLEAGRLLLDIGDYAAACRHFARALLQSPNPKVVRLQDQALASLVKDAEQGLSPSLKSKYFKGVERLRRGDTVAAAEILAKVARRAPLFAQGWAAWRGALDASGDAAGAADLPRLWAKMGGPGPGVASSAMRRRLGSRGLVFDPREPVPWRKKEEVLRPVASAAELRAAPDSFWLIAEGGQRRRLRPALTPEGTPDSSVEAAYRTREVFVVSMSDAAVVGRGAVLTRDGELLYDLVPRQDPAKYGGAWDGRTIQFDPRLFRDGALNVIFHERPAFLMTGPTDTSFGDWMLNFLPRLSLYRAAGLDCDIVIRSDPVANARQWITALGVPESRVVYHDVQGVSVFPTLYAPAWPMPAGRPMDGLFDIYHSADAPAGAPVGRKLYLSREGRGRRPLVNEAEIEALFVSRGFEVVRPETLSFPEMRCAFAQPACVAGAYGSAILNLAVCKSRPKCLFLVPPERPTFLKQLALWMSGMDLSFRYLVGEQVGDGPEEKIAPWRVDTAEVGRLIDQMLMHDGPARAFHASSSEGLPFTPQ